MIPVTEPDLYEEALSCLQEHSRSFGKSFKGRFVQIFLGLKFFQNEIPSMYSGAFIETPVIQSIFDDLYAKNDRELNCCVLSLFTGSYLARTGLVGEGNSVPQNTWRNNFNLQKGIGCFAPSSDLSSDTFLNQERSDCRHLVPGQEGGFTNATCSVCTTDAKYRNESHRKWLQINPSGSGYAVTDLQRTSNFAPYVAENHRRLPIFPLVIALYHRGNPGLVIGHRNRVSIEQFASDFNFCHEELNAYFDVSRDHILNKRIHEHTSWSDGEIPAEEPVSQIAQVETESAPILTGTPTPPPCVNSGWEAEQFVAAAFESEGWTVYSVARQQLGYDLYAQRGRTILYIEVKSSLGACSPTLTSREWQQAHLRGASYILAVVENFNPDDENTVYCIPNPSVCCAGIEQISVAYRIARTSWINQTVPIGQL